jgi:hypothetical protein
MPVLVFVNTTVAFGTTAPVVSVTAPETVAFGFCAELRAPANNSPTSKGLDIHFKKLPVTRLTSNSLCYKTNRFALGEFTSMNGSILL